MSTTTTIILFILHNIISTLICWLVLKYQAMMLYPDNKYDRNQYISDKDFFLLFVPIFGIFFIIVWFLGTRAYKLLKLISLKIDLYFQTIALKKLDQEAQKALTEEEKLAAINNGAEYRSNPKYRDEF